MAAVGKSYLNSPLFTQLGFVTVVLIGGFAVAPVYGQATQTTSIFRVPFSSGGISLCGTPVVFSGTLIVVDHFTTGPNGGTYILDHLSFEHGTVVTASGATGTITESDTTAVEVTPISATAILETVNGHITIQGEGIDTLVHVTFLIAFNANGQPTASVQHIDLKCPPT